MRFLLLAFILTAFSNASPPPASVIEWIDAVDYDFGDIPAGQPVSFDFKFHNISDNALTVDNVRTTCGCTASNWSEIPTPPDSTGFIHITYDARKKGYFYKKIKVFFHGQRKGELLTIQGYVEE